MALHRDIYWVGRQWAVTGYGLQLIDQRLKGVFDIEIERLWDTGVLDAMRAREWLKAEDFEKAIAAAHKRFPEPVSPCPDPQPELIPVPVETQLKPREPVAPAPAILPLSTLDPGAESSEPKAGLENKAVLPVELPLSPSEPVVSVPAALPPFASHSHPESASAKADPPSKPALPVDTLSWPGEPVAPASANLPLSNLDFRAESERARADLERKMSALDGLLRSRAGVAAQPVIPPPSILPVRAEGELAKFAPQWRVRN